MNITLLKSSGAVAIALMLAACGSDPSDEPISEALADNGSITRFNQGMETTGLSGVLEGEASYTLLAPTDTAFEALGDDAVAMLDDPESGAIVAAVLREHMLPGAIDPDAIRATIEQMGGEVYVISYGNSELRMALDGDDLVVRTESGRFARLGDSSTEGENGVVIPIDAVLVDPSALAGGGEELASR